MSAEAPVAVADYEREPVPKKARLGFKSFVGQYAGAHTAGTELMIGPLFVAAGVVAANGCRGEGRCGMKRLLPWLSWLSLLVVIVPPVLYSPLVSTKRR